MDKLKTATAFAIVAVFLFIVIFSGQNDLMEDCVTRSEVRVVRGDSLSGIIESGDSIILLWGFYNCSNIQRGDIIAYNYAGGDNPIIKRVFGLAGDRFYLSEDVGGWNIFVNGRIIKNSLGEKYLINSSKHKMLSLYEKSYGGVIPPKALLILGNQASGSLDSSQIGLVGEDGVLGKVLLYK